MALLDFIKNRDQQQPVAEKSQEQRPETAKEMYTREAAQEPASRKPVEQMPESAKREAVEAARPAAQAMNEGTRRDETPSIPSGHEDGKEALIRNQGDQGKTQEALSPTDHGKSQTATQERTQDRGRGWER